MMGRSPRCYIPSFVEIGPQVPEKKIFEELLPLIYFHFHVPILRGTRNLSFVLRRSLLRVFETIWILVITLECSNITASKSIRLEREMRPMELPGVNFSTHGSESECSCFDQALCIRV